MNCLQFANRISLAQAVADALPSDLPGGVYTAVKVLPHDYSMPLTEGQYSFWYGSELYLCIPNWKLDKAEAKAAPEQASDAMAQRTGAAALCFSPTLATDWQALACERLKRVAERDAQIRALEKQLVHLSAEAGEREKTVTAIFNRNRELQAAINTFANAHASR